MALCTIARIAANAPGTSRGITKRTAGKAGRHQPAAEGQDCPYFPQNQTDIVQKEVHP